MASSTYTPADVVDMSKEKDWAAKLGMMDWDSTRIVFTKRGLIEFLRYTGTTVDTNFSNIQKLPKYAEFGKLSHTGETGAAPPPASTSEPITLSESSSPADGFKPTRRVRTAPGGEQHDIFGHDVDDDALANAPPRPSADADPSPPEAVTRSLTEVPAGRNRPSLFDQSAEPEQFKPTRRVREMPGGRDNLAGIL